MCESVTCLQNSDITPELKCWFQISLEVYQVVNLHNFIHFTQNLVLSLFVIRRENALFWASEVGVSYISQFSGVTLTLIIHDKLNSTIIVVSKIIYSWKV